MLCRDGLHNVVSLILCYCNGKSSNLKRNVLSFATLPQSTVATRGVLDRLTQSKADEHLRDSIRISQPRFEEESQESVLDSPTRDVWINRQNILFNKDFGGALRQVHQLEEKLGSIKDGRKHQKAVFEHSAWNEESHATRHLKPLYEHHTNELINYLQDKVKEHAEVGNNFKAHKWYNKLNIVTGNDIKAIKALEKDYHIKALKANGNKLDWVNLLRPDLKLESTTLPIEFYSTPDKKGLQRSSKRGQTSTDRSNQSDGMDIDSGNGMKKLYHQPAYLPEEGHAINRQRLEEKIRNADSKQTRLKWEDRLKDVNNAPLPQHKQGKIKYYHNKEVGHRWSQLHYASAAHFAKLKQVKSEGKRLSSYAFGDEASASKRVASEAMSRQY